MATIEATTPKDGDAYVVDYKWNPQGVRATRFKIGDRVECDRSRLLPAKGTWTRYYGRIGHVVVADNDGEVGVRFGSERNHGLTTWFLPEELKLTGKRALIAAQNQKSTPDSAEPQEPRNPPTGKPRGLPQVSCGECDRLADHGRRESDPVHCPKCHLTWGGVEAQHCVRCHQTFNSPTAANSHRRGSKCLVPSLVEGWVEVRQNVWAKEKDGQ